MVQWYWKCNCCGSIVIHFDGTKKSVTEQYIKDNGIDLTKSIRLTNSYSCENCFPIEKICEYIMK